MYDTPESSPADNTAHADQPNQPLEGRQMTSEEASNARAHSSSEDKRQTLTHAVWLLIALIVPFLLVFLTSHEDRAIALGHSFRLGLTSFFVALAILGLSQIDKKVLGASFDSKSQVLASLLGVMLWLVWVGSGQMVYKAVDEAKAGAIVDYGPPQ